MRISDWSSDVCSSDLTARALRFYEDEGLIAPERQGLARIYSRRDRARLAWILRGKRVGFSLSDIREMIDLYDADEEHEEQLRVTVAKCESRIALLNRQKEDIVDTIAELLHFLDVLQQYSNSPPHKKIGRA